MTKQYFFAHHVGGRGATVSFPELPAFADSVYNVIYDADEGCIPEIEGRRKTLTKVMPYCLADSSRQASFNINVCPFTSSMFQFNEAFGHYYEEKRANYSDYLFRDNFAPRRVVGLTTESIDGLFAAQRIPQVDFLSVDTQGAELLILSGARHMLSSTTVAVSCEVSFVDLYQGGPLFGDLDRFLRDAGFMLANLTSMSFGYKRIPRRFRGLGMPLQGEALYFLKPDQITNAEPAERQRRLETLAFCALAFGYTELAFEAADRALAIGVAERNAIQDVLRDFHRRVQQAPGLPPLWDESMEPPQNAPPPGPLPLRLWKRFAANPSLFRADLHRIMTKRGVQLARMLKRPRWAFNEFERFLKAAGFEQAAAAVCLRSIG